MPRLDFTLVLFSIYGLLDLKSKLAQDWGWVTFLSAIFLISSMFHWLIVLLRAKCLDFKVFNSFGKVGGYFSQCVASRQIKGSVTHPFVFLTIHGPDIGLIS